MTPEGMSISARMSSRIDPLARTVAVPVEQAPVHVLVPAQREEVELLVVVERRLVTQTLPDRVGVGVDLEVVGVVVDLVVSWQRQYSDPFPSCTRRPAGGSTDRIPAFSNFDVNVNNTVALSRNMNSDSDRHTVTE